MAEIATMDATVSVPDDLTFLAGLPLFRDVPAHELRILSRFMRRETFAPGKIVFRQDDPGFDLIVIREGTVCVFLTRDSERIDLAELGAGSYFGEMSLFDEYPRSANAEALTEVKVFRLDRPAFFSFVRNHPASLIQMCKIFSHRLRNTNSFLTKR